MERLCEREAGAEKGGKLTSEDDFVFCGDAGVDFGHDAALLDLLDGDWDVSAF